MKKTLYGTRLYINFTHLASNIKYIQSRLHDSSIIAMVKANAYGYGDIQISKKLYDLGINYFGVADFEEGVRLRKAGVNGRIIVIRVT